MFDALPPLERRVLRLRFGLENGRSRTLDEVARDLRLSREFVQHVEAEALLKLKRP